MSDLYIFNWIGEYFSTVGYMHETKISFHKFIIRVRQCTELVIKGGWTACLETVWKGKHKKRPTLPNRIHCRSRKPRCDVQNGRMIRRTCKDVRPLSCKLYNTHDV